MEASTCAYQHVVEASIGHSWTAAEEGPALPQVTKLVETMLDAVGMHVPAWGIWECWDTVAGDVPQQNTDSMQGVIVCWLDEYANWQLPTRAWDPFTYPDKDVEKEEYSLIVASRPRSQPR